MMTQDECDVGEYLYLNRKELGELTRGSFPDVFHNSRYVDIINEEFKDHVISTLISELQNNFHNVDLYLIINGPFVNLILGEGFIKYEQI